MAKFFGTIGYSVTEETKPGVWTDTVVERPYTGDVVTNKYQWINKDQVNPDSNISDVISVIADGYILENRYIMKYVKWRGVILTVESIVIERPRAIISIGGLFNGLTKPASKPEQ